MQAETRTHMELAQFIMHVHDTRQWGRNKLSYGKGRPKIVLLNWAMHKSSVILQVANTAG